MVLQCRHSEIARLENLATLPTLIAMKEEEIPFKQLARQNSDALTLGNIISHSIGFNATSQATS